MPYGRTRRTEITCRCPVCGYETTIEEGEKCEAIECPKCGHKMREV